LISSMINSAAPLAPFACSLARYRVPFTMVKSGSPAVLLTAGVMPDRNRGTWSLVEDRPKGFAVHLGGCRNVFNNPSSRGNRDAAHGIELRWATCRSKTKGCFKGQSNFGQELGLARAVHQTPARCANVRVALTPVCSFHLPLQNLRMFVKSI
jgi:hypothetical protein